MKRICATLVIFLISACGGGGNSSGVSASGDAGPDGTSQPANVDATITVFGGELLNRFITAGGLSRQYSLFRPDNSSHKKLPLVIWFHGAGGIVWPGIQNDYWVQIAKREGFYLLEPQAIKDQYASYTYWNAGLGAPKDDALFVKTVLDKVLADENIDTDRIYEGGMSSGGHMAFYMAQKLWDKVAAVAPIAGSIASWPDVIDTYNLQRPMPLCHIHGTADTVVNMNGGDWYVPWSNILGLWRNNNKISNPPSVSDLPNLSAYDGSTVTKLEYRGPTVASDIDDYRINGGGHSVPGVESSANQDINAYEVIWSFFKNHKLSDAM